VIILSDLHLKEANEHLVWEVLDRVEELAVEDPDCRVVFTGDWWQLRYQVSVRLLNLVHERLTRWVARDINVDLVPGNHDQVTVQGVNALEILARDGVDVWTEPGISEVREGWPGRWCGYVPYRKDPEGQLAALEAVLGALRVEEAAHPVVFGHFGVHGALMNNGQKDRGGLEAGDQDSYLLVLGHYHKHHAPAPGVVYVGSPFQHTFGEVGNRTGVGRVLWVDGGVVFDQIELDVGPKHYVVSWDVAKEERPPAPESLVNGQPRPQDKVRVDIVAPPSLINKDLTKRLMTAGYEDAQVNVQPAPEKREHRFPLVPGESLVELAERFVAHRFEKQIDPDEDPLCRKLHEWAGEL